MEKHIVYGLKCPIDGIYRYIGKSKNGLSRPRQHLVMSHNTSVRLWVDELRDIGLCPIIDIIEECSEENLSERESFWIDYFNRTSGDLMNIHEYKGRSVSELEKEIKELEQQLRIKLTSVNKELESIETIHGSIKYIRKLRNVSQETLSDISGVSLRTIKKIESGDCNPTLKVLNKLCDALGVKLSITTNMLI